MHLRRGSHAFARKRPFPESILEIRVPPREASPPRGPRAASTDCLPTSSRLGRRHSVAIVGVDVRVEGSLRPRREPSQVFRGSVAAIDRSTE